MRFGQAAGVDQHAVRARQGLQGGQVAAVVAVRRAGVFLRRRQARSAMQRQRFGAAAGLRQQLVLDRGVHHVLRHAAVCRPLAARHRHQPGVGHQDGVLARQLLGRRLTRGLDERTQAGPDAGDVVTRRLAAQVARGRAQDEVHVLGAGFGVQRQVVTRRVGRANDGVAVPRHHEQHAAVVDARPGWARPSSARSCLPCGARHPPRRRWR
ncbi:hypothetical protein G6F35_014431 [Rhizopus arrhizus]|nr:hypothetical protein G6F35_014431 [Rhizopus arrhizus]